MKLDQMYLADSHSCSPPKLRPMTSELNTLSRPDGSALFNMGDTAILAAVYGPGEVQIRKELIDKATVEVIHKPKVGLSGCAEKLTERLMRNTCETVILAALHPKTAITVVVQEMQDSGSYLACGINACCMALLDAAVPLKFMMAAVQCMISAEGQIIVDPTKKQEVEAVAAFTFAYDSRDYSVITSSTRGSFSNDQFQQCLLCCREASKEVINFYENTTPGAIFSYMPS